MSGQNMKELFGDGRGEYAVGDQLTFTEDGEEFTGKIIAIMPPGQTVSGRHHPTTYIVDCDRGWPSSVYSSQIVAR
jgi:hypothetical protein